MQAIKFIFINSTGYQGLWNHILKRLHHDEYIVVSLLDHWQKNSNFAALDELEQYKLNEPFSEIPFFIAHSWGACFLWQHLIEKPYHKAYALILEPEDFLQSDQARQNLLNIQKLDKTLLTDYLKQLYQQVCLKNSSTKIIAALDNQENFTKACIYNAIEILLQPQLIHEIALLPYHISFGLADYGAGDLFFEKRCSDFPFLAHYNIELIRFYHCDHFCFNGPGENILLASLAGAIKKHETL